jgi:hypothetical protein
MSVVNDFGRTIAGGLALGDWPAGERVRDIENPPADQSI